MIKILELLDINSQLKIEGDLMKDCGYICEITEKFICCLYCYMRTDYCGNKCDHFEEYFKEESFICPDEKK